MAKTFKKLLLRNKKAYDLDLGMKHRVPEYYQVCLNDDPYAFVWDKGKTMDVSKTIVVCDIRVGRCS